MSRAPRPGPSHRHRTGPGRPSWCSGHRAPGGVRARRERLLRCGRAVLTLVGAALPAPGGGAERRGHHPGLRLQPRAPDAHEVALRLVAHPLPPGTGLGPSRGGVPPPPSRWRRSFPRCSISGARCCGAGGRGCSPRSPSSSSRGTSSTPTSAASTCRWRRCGSWWCTCSGARRRTSASRPGPASPSAWRWPPSTMPSSCRWSSLPFGVLAAWRSASTEAGGCWSGWGRPPWPSSPIWVWS